MQRQKGRAKERTTGSRWARVWREWLKPILIVVIVCGSFRSAVADWNDVPTGSMKPTILEGDRILVNKMAYDLRIPFTSWRLWEWDGPKRGDVVVCFSPADGKRLVKRVIAVPGDTVELRGNRLHINGEAAGYGPLDDDTIAQLAATEQPQHRYVTETIGSHRHAVMDTPGVPALRSFGPVISPQDAYFVMGDNRDNSLDSRMLGFIPRREIVGRAWRIAFSVDPARHHLPRWGRTLRALE